MPSVPLTCVHAHRDAKLATLGSSRTLPNCRNSPQLGKYSTVKIANPSLWNVQNLMSEPSAKVDVLVCELTKDLRQGFLT